MSRTIFFFILIIICKSATAQQPLVTIPFLTQGSHTFIKVRLDSGNKEYLFLFDTGAGSSVVSPALVKAENLVLSPRDTILETAGGYDTVPITLNNTLNLEGKPVSGFNFFIDDLSNMSFQGMQVDGAIGYELLRNYVSVLNYEKGQLELYPQGTKLHGGTKAHPFRLIEDIPAIELHFKTPKGTRRKGLFYLDSGGGFALSFNAGYAKKLHLIDEFERNTKITAIGGASGITFYNYLVSLNEVSWEDQIFRDVPASISQATDGVSNSSLIDGILGLEIIKRFNVVLDYQNKKVQWIPNQAVALPFTFNVTGLSMRFSNNQLLVSQVLEGSPAQKAGFSQGDIIQSINGKSYQNTGEARSLINQPGATFLFKITRDQQTLDLTLIPSRFY